MSEETDIENKVTEVASAPVETDAVIAADAPKPSRNLGGKFVFGLSILAAALGLFGPLGSGWGLWPWQTGLMMVPLSLLCGIFAVLFGWLIGWWQKRRGASTPKLLRWAGMLVGFVVAGWWLGQAIAARSVPAIHDISTDLADVPQFRTLSVRADNLDSVPGATDAEMKGMTPQQRWVMIHQKAYGDIRSARIEQPVVDVIAKAERLAKARDWDIAVVDPQDGRLEATATTALFHFKDDVVLRIRPTEDGKGSIVDMRSISRVGQSDIGTNAKRIRAFLADLSGTVTAGQ